jgi:hypothetical protein
VKLIMAKEDDVIDRDLEATLPESFPISVILESKPAKSKWVDLVWQVVGITVGHSTDELDDEIRLVRSSGDTNQYLFSGLKVALYKDECESYYHNMMTPTPRAYVVAHVDDNEAAPEPFLVSMSFDEAHAYLEGEDEIYDVDIPPELYVWVEAYVLINYVAEKRKKRKRVDWKEKAPEQRPS